MKSGHLIKAIFLMCLSIITFADSDTNAKTLSYKDEKDEVGNYEYSFETSNGISRHESGVLENAGQPDAHLAVIGSYKYTAPDGQVIEVYYIADDNGFRIVPPTPPPIPLPIAPQVSSALVASLLG